MTLCPRIVELVNKERLENVMVLVGGIIPDQDVVKLKECGVAEIFLPRGSDAGNCGLHPTECPSKSEYQPSAFLLRLRNSKKLGVDGFVAQDQT